MIYYHTACGFAVRCIYPGELPDGTGKLVLISAVALAAVLLLDSAYAGRKA
jgi:hypothetical protein